MSRLVVPDDQGRGRCNALRPCSVDVRLDQLVHQVHVFRTFLQSRLVQFRKVQCAARQPAPVAGRLSEDRIDSAPEGFGAALDPCALHQASLVAGRLAMHLQGKMAPNQVHVRMAVYPALKPRGVDLAEGALQVGVFIDRPARFRIAVWSVPG